MRRQKMLNYSMQLKSLLAYPLETVRIRSYIVESKKFRWTIRLYSKMECERLSRVEDRRWISSVQSGDNGRCTGLHRLEIFSMSIVVAMLVWNMYIFFNRQLYYQFFLANFTPLYHQRTNSTKISSSTTTSTSIVDSLTDTIHSAITASSSTFVTENLSSTTLAKPGQ